MLVVFNIIFFTRFVNLTYNGINNNNIYLLEHIINEEPYSCFYGILHSGRMNSQT